MTGASDAAMRPRRGGRRPLRAGRRGRRRATGWTRFVAERLAAYRRDRDRPDLPATSRLSAHLTWGEISPRDGLARRRARAMEAGAAGAETFLKELVWREFAWHLHLAHAADRDRELARGLGRLSLARRQRRTPSAGGAA